MKSRTVHATIHPLFTDLVPLLLHLAPGLAFIQHDRARSQIPALEWDRTAECPAAASLPEPPR